MSENDNIKIFNSIYPMMKRHLDMLTQRHWDQKILNAKNILNKKGKKFFSQNDEDGILLEILKRIEINKGSFLEIGVSKSYGNTKGTENNTIILLMNDWKGIWIDAEDIDLKLSKDSRLSFTKKTLNKDNCIEVVEDCLKKNSLSHNDINVVSVDIDGNDFYIAEQILKCGLQPDCFIVEYNSKFPPPIKYNMPYNEDYIWKGGDDQGSSLSFWENFFVDQGYRLVCCNITGTNAFFINTKYNEKFEDIPKDINQIYYAPDYNWFTQIGHTTNPRTIEYFANKKNTKV